MVPLVSSNLKGYDYNSDSYRLTIYFLNGAAWNYFNVKPELVDDLESCIATNSSVGKFFHARIRGQYKEHKIDPEFDNLFDEIEKLWQARRTIKYHHIKDLREAQIEWEKHLPPESVNTPNDEEVIKGYPKRTRQSL